MTIRTIAHGSNDYQAMMKLRIDALLTPIGVPAHYIQPEAEKNDLLIGAFENENIIGCCILTAREEKTVQLRQMVVAPSHRGQSIGSDILAFAEATARKEGFGLLMMHARNEAISFYRKNGYAISSEEFFEVGIGHHQMNKTL